MSAIAGSLTSALGVVSTNAASPAAAPAVAPPTTMAAVAGRKATAAAPPAAMPTCQGGGVQPGAGWGQPGAAHRNAAHHATHEPSRSSPSHPMCGSPANIGKQVGALLPLVIVQPAAGRTEGDGYYQLRPSSRGHLQSADPTAAASQFDCAAPVCAALGALLHAILRPRQPHRTHARCSRERLPNTSATERAGGMQISRRPLAPQNAGVPGQLLRRPTALDRAARSPWAAHRSAPRWSVWSCTAHQPPLAPHPSARHPAARQGGLAAGCARGAKHQLWLGPCTTKETRLVLVHR